MKKEVKIFDPPEMAFLALTIIIGLGGMYFGHFWPPQTPGGCQGGVGGSGGVPGTKKCDFFGSHILVSKLGNFGLCELKTLYFLGFWPKMAPQETKNGRFWAEMGEHNSAFFSKTPSLNCLKMHHNKVLGSILM